ncbi:MAG: aminoglycoside phosphotransferase family protein [Proteobacteria bacterium]|nr:aminoglycoside phosphotransferase family protein [Pseudomonadota bacterium]
MDDSRDDPLQAVRGALAVAWGLSPRAQFSPLGNGLINRTLLMRDEDGRQRVLQCLNANVFPDPAMVMRNCRAVTSHLGRERAAGRYAYSVLELVPTLAGESALVLPDGTWWRMYDHVPDTHTCDAADDPAMTRAAARAFAAFAAALAGLPAGSIGEVIPEFHDPVSRFRSYQTARQADRAGRVAECVAECESADRFAGLLPQWQALIRRGLPSRITHNDCKLNNLLFDDRGEATCVVDLDTVMPGSLLFDFGDMARTMLSPVPEDSVDLAEVRVRRDHFAALAAGYVEGCGNLLTPLEREHLVFGARLVTGVIALRFLADHLDGDRYFRITHPAHNLERARNQWALFAALDRDAGALQSLVPAG